MVHVNEPNMGYFINTYNLHIENKIDAVTVYIHILKTQFQNR